MQLAELLRVQTQSRGSAGGSSGTVSVPGRGDGQFAPAFWLLKKGVEKEADENQDADLSDGEPDKDPVLRCAQCDSDIARKRDAISVNGASPTQVHSNPMGLLYEILTVSSATNLRRHGSPSQEFTWFPGYSWQVVVCVGCGTHLGWHFQASGGSPPAFWGLLYKRLREC